MKRSANRIPDPIAQALAKRLARYEYGVFG